MTHDAKATFYSKQRFSRWSGYEHHLVPGRGADEMIQEWVPGVPGVRSDFKFCKFDNGLVGMIYHDIPQVQHTCQVMWSIRMPYTMVFVWIYLLYAGTDAGTSDCMYLLVLFWKMRRISTHSRYGWTKHQLEIEMGTGMYARKVYEPFYLWSFISSYDIQFLVTQS